jgi:Sec-independent protein translocase protein TatA
MGLGVPELLIILAVVLIIFGPTSCRSRQRNR